MERKKIFVTHRYLGMYLNGLNDDKYEMVVHDGKDITREELLKGVRGASGIVSLLTEKIDKEVFESAGDTLKVVSNYAVGYDNIDIGEASARGVCVTNTPGVLTAAVAEEVIALTMCLLRRIAEGDRFVRRGLYKGWEPDLLVGTGLREKTMGIIGLGRIGRWTARMAKALGMNVIYFNRHRDLEFEEEVGVIYHSFQQTLEMADVVSLSVSLNEETRHMIGKAEFRLMKRSAVLINTARGAIVDEEALVEALREGVIAGAGLDVFEDEMKINKELLKMENTVLTPHIASATVEARASMGKLVRENLVDVLEGRRPDCLINCDVWKDEV